MAVSLAFVYPWYSVAYLMPHYANDHIVSDFQFAVKFDKAISFIIAILEIATAQYTAHAFDYLDPYTVFLGIRASQFP